MFDSVDPRQRFPDLELGILRYWQEEDTFKRSLLRRKGGEVFSFYDGPPFATGLPHYGHILAGTIKDVIPRYQTMRGKYVRRRFGWDCHGLPVENEIEKEKNLKSKKDIECLGVACFNDLCRGAVQRYSKEWRQTVERLGRWVDMDWDYRTMDPDYMESIWWVFKQLWKQELIYEGRKAMHICPRCSTPLSNFEVTQGYKDKDDTAVTWKFKLKESKGTKEPKESKGQKPVYVLAWTTTPWSTLSTMGLSIKPDAQYVRVDMKDEAVIMVKDRLADVMKGIKEYEVTEEFPGSSLVGSAYEHIAPWYKDVPTIKENENVYHIFAGDYVDPSEGTGIVTINGSYGEIDMEAAKKNGLPILMDVDMTGHFTEHGGPYAGMYVQDAVKQLVDDAKKKGLVWRKESHRHSYPHCWRCDTPLLNYATSSWFVAVEKIKEKMLAANAKTHWVPAHIRDGRFGKWLEGARDWAVSRNRFWGTPLPIWRNSITGDIDIIGSREELMEKAVTRFTKVIVTRHAESQGNVDKIYQGKVPGTPLTETGQKQAQALAERIGKGKNDAIPLKTIYCSPLQRTRETAEAIAKQMGATVVVDARLREVEFGEFEGKHVDFDDLTFVRERRAHKIDKNQVESIYHFQGMETWDSIELRLNEFLDEVLPKHRGETIGVVTHADVMLNAAHFFTKNSKHKIVHQPYPELASMATYYWDHDRKAQMDLHKETVDGIMWNAAEATKKPARDASRGTVEVTLVRHGETDLNKQRLAQGSEVDMPLNKVGKEQAKEAAERLKGQTFDAILTSDLRRAQDTAKIIAKELNMEIEEPLTLLRERSLGDWSKQNVDEIMAALGPVKNKRGLCFSTATPPNGEPFEQLLSRARQLHDLLLKKYAGKRVLIVAHSGILQSFSMVSQNLSYENMPNVQPKNAGAMTLTLRPQMRRIDEVLDCWFESGSMPYAQEHFPFDTGSNIPPGFPADFIAEGLDQTRGWFYTLTVLSSALFNCPAFRHCVVNGIVLAEDGRKMSKRLKNYPEPTEVVKRHGADAVRFALMASPAVRGEDLRFSEKLVEETVRTVLLPLWNAYRLFVTYANAVDFKPSIDFSLKNAPSKNLLDRWIISKTQELANAMTGELDGYDLSATCAHLAGSIDDLTNWYVRLSRRRLAGRGESKNAEAEQKDALDTLYRVLVCNAQLLAPFCPFISEAIYLNLVGEEHGSVHFLDWPMTRELTADDKSVVELMENTRTVVSLGLKLRADAKVRVRMPLQSVTFALPPSNTAGVVKDIIAEELNVKQVIDVVDAGTLATRIVQVDARKVGPRLGSKVQDLIRAGKAGQFTEKDGAIVIAGETLAAGEASIVYQGKEGHAVAADRGIVVTIDATQTEALILEGQARELIHWIQSERKEAGLEFTDTIELELTGADALLESHKELILDETRAELKKNKGKKLETTLGDLTVSMRFEKKGK